MKQSVAKRKLTNFLKTWEGSKISDGKCAKELLEFVEKELGMLPPPLKCPLADGGEARLYMWELDNNKRRKNDKRS